MSSSTSTASSTSSAAGCCSKIPATYLRFDDSTIAETAFLSEIARRTGCGLLLDVNNVMVASANHGQDPLAYLAAFPLHAVREIHLGGHAERLDEAGEPMLIDSHDMPVAPAVWRLYEGLVGTTGPIATLVEWDDDVPGWPALLREAEAARSILDRHARRHVA